jgi:enoyl-CoA hydratase/carnithine racemase
MHRLGVFNEVLPREQVLPRARALAAELAEKSPISMKLLRDAFVRANDLDYRRAMESVVETMCSLRDSVDSTEALAAFVEKRAPVFQGR